MNDQVKYLTLKASFGELFVGVPIILMLLVGAWPQAAAWFLFWAGVNWLFDGAIYPIE